MSIATLAEKRQLAQELNAALGPIGLGLAFHPQHAFGTLIGHETKGEPEGRFSLRMREGGVIVSLGSAKRLTNVYVGPRSEFKSRE
jgi:hypothetical protein